MSWNLTGRQLWLPAGAAIVLVGVCVHRAVLPVRATGPRAAPEWADSIPDTLGATGEAPRVRHDTIAVRGVATPAAVQMLAIEDTEVATVAEYTGEKYQFLFEDLRYLPADRIAGLRRTLLERELLAGAIGAARESADPEARRGLAAQEAALAKSEQEIRGMLSSAEHATYELLKDSDLEQFKLGEYAGGISNVAPLSREDRRAILKTKLAYKARFQQLVADSGLRRENLSAAERQYAFSITSRALEDYQRSYLQEVRQYLTNDEQFVLLSNYENTEFAAELARLWPEAGR